MVATSLPAKPKLVEEPCADLSGEFENIKTNDRGCCKRGICWPLVKLLTLLVLLVFFSLILSGQINALCHVFDNTDSEVKMSFERPTHVTFPAITVCNNNPIQKSKFCQTYPEQCSSSTDGKAPAVNLSSFYRLMTNMTPADTIPLGQSWQDFTETCLLVHSIDESNVECKNARNIYWSLSHQNCFTFLSGEEKLSGDYRKAAFWMVLDFQPEENVDNSTTVGGQLFIHDADNRIPVGFPISSYTLKPGKMYRYRLRQTNYYRLSSPYESGCKYYDVEGENSSQEECYNKCLYDKFISSCGCMPDIIPFFDAGHSTRYCKGDNTSRNCEKAERKTIEETCNNFCPIKCTESSYDVKVDEFDIPDYNSDIQNSKSHLANIWIKFDSNEQKTYSEVPVQMNTFFLFYLILLYSVAVFVFVLKLIKTMIEMHRLCKTDPKKNSEEE